VFKHKFSQTGLPYLIFALLLAAVIIYFEQHLVALSDKVEIITISAENDDNSAVAISNATIKIEELGEQSKQLITELIDTKDIISSLANNPKINALSDLEKNGFHVVLARTLYGLQNYSVVTEILEQFPITQRLNNDSQFNYAYSLAKTSNYESAIEQYKILIAHQANAQAANLNQALLLKKLDRCDDAIPVFKHTISISSGDKKAKALSGLASCYYKQDNFSKAVIHFKKSIEYRPNSSSTWALLAKSYASLNLRQQALDSFNKSIALSSNNYKVHVQKARFQLINYDFKDAISTLKIANSLSNDLEIIELMAWAYLEQGQRSLARKKLTYLLKHSPSKQQKKHAHLLQMYINKQYKDVISELKNERKLRADMLYLKAISYRKIGYFDSASKLFKRLLENKSYTWRSQINQARITRSRQLYSDAMKQYQTLIDYNSNAHFLWFEAALIDEKTRQYDHGLIKIAHALTITPDNNVYLLAKARLTHLSNDFDGAIELLEQLLSTTPKYARALHLMAEFLNEQEDVTKLLAIYKRLLEINNGDFLVMFNYAQALIKIENHHAAQAVLKTALEVQPDSIDTRFLLASSYNQSQNHTMSLQELDNLLRLDHNNPQALSLKKAIIAKQNKE